MKCIIILGSRNHEGQTATAARAIMEGYGGEGGQCEQMFLPEQAIERCRQCENTGWGRCRSEGSCVIEDDFGDVVTGIRAADVVVFATPVYFGDLSESLRAFLDRLRRITRHESGQRGIADKPAIGICVAGGGGGGAPSCAVSLEKVLTPCGIDLLDIVLVRRQNLDIKLSVLKTVGRWLTEAK